MEVDNNCMKLKKNMYRIDCPSCKFKNKEIFFEIKQTPVNSVINIKTKKEALTFPRGEIKLSYCNNCGFIYNSKFDPEKVRYTNECEESQSYSNTFDKFSKEIAKKLIEKYNLKNKTILEIGCGKGEFLKMICDLSGARGIGFDPAYVPGRGSDRSDKRIEFIVDYYNEKYKHYRGDFICCRMTLEHISETKQFVLSIKKAIKDNESSIVFIQVPNVTRILEKCSFEDIYYEHCSYFSTYSLERLFSENGFKILNMNITYGKQYILLEAKLQEKEIENKKNIDKELKSFERLVKEFKKRKDIVHNYWEKIIDQNKQKKRKIVIWGAGSKGVAFLNNFSSATSIEYAVDVNPYRQGTYMAGTGQLIVSPEFLKKYKPDTVIIMNPIYKKEISEILRKMNISPKIHFLGEFVPKFLETWDENKL